MRPVNGEDPTGRQSSVSGTGSFRRCSTLSCLMLFRSINLVQTSTVRNLSFQWIFETFSKWLKSRNDGTNGVLFWCVLRDNSRRAGSLSSNLLTLESSISSVLPHLTSIERTFFLKSSLYKTLRSNRINGGAADRGAINGIGDGCHTTCSTNIGRARTASRE